MIRFCAAAVAGILLASPAAAEVVTFKYIARVDATGSYPTSFGGPVPVPVPLGALVWGSFSYDDALLPTRNYQDADVKFATYDTNPLMSFGINFSAYVQSGVVSYGFSQAGAADAGVWDADANLDWTDSIDLFSIGTRSGGFTYGLSIDYPNRASLSSTRLPIAFPDTFWQGSFEDPDDDNPLGLPYGSISFSGEGRGFFATVYSITRLNANANAVPEPATWIMMIAGFGMVGGALRRRNAGAQVLLAA